MSVANFKCTSALRQRSATVAGPMRGWCTRMFSPHQPVHGGLPTTTTYGLVAPRMRMTRSRSS
eukprot:8959775-Alexandrium_andersonii.AAC.1